MLNPIVMIGWVARDVNRAPVMGISASQAVAPSGNVALIYSKAGAGGEGSVEMAATRVIYCSWMILLIRID